jgi:hypothetical protein
MTFFLCPRKGRGRGDSNFDLRKNRLYIYRAWLYLLLENFFRMSKCININFQSQSGRQLYIFFISQIKWIFLLDLL